MVALGLSCSMWDLVPWSGIEPGLLALIAWSLSHWTTREILEVFFKILISHCLLLAYRNRIDFCILVFYLSTLLDSLINVSTIFRVFSGGNRNKTVIPSTIFNGKFLKFLYSLSASLQVWKLHIFFFDDYLLKLKKSLIFYQTIRALESFINNWLHSPAYMIVLLRVLFLSCFLKE